MDADLLHELLLKRVLAGVAGKRRPLAHINSGRKKKRRGGTSKGTIAVISMVHFFSWLMSACKGGRVDADDAGHASRQAGRQHAGYFWLPEAGRMAITFVLKKPAGSNCRFSWRNQPALPP